MQSNISIIVELSTLFIEPTAKTPQIDLNPMTGELDPVRKVYS